MKSRNVGSSIIDTKLEPPGGGGGKRPENSRPEAKDPFLLCLGT